MGKGIITKIFGWIEHPTLDTDTDPTDWFLFLIFILCVTFLWTRVIKQLDEAL